MEKSHLISELQVMVGTVSLLDEKDLIKSNVTESLMKKINATGQAIDRSESDDVHTKSLRDLQGSINSLLHGDEISAEGYSMLYNKCTELLTLINPNYHGDSEIRSDNNGTERQAGRKRIPSRQHNNNRKKPRLS